MWKFLRHFLLPHHSNNQRAKLIHSQSIFLVMLVLLAGSFFVSSVKKTFPQVLGANVDISAQTLLLLTNESRTQAGLPVLQLNDQLSQAAEGKAQDMFTKDYWAHFAPDGTSPWDFIHGAGYNYVYAGENLARGFNDSQSVINAWLASPEHRANMLSSHYTDVGFAIERGRLPGDNDTVLVVEMLGSRNAQNTEPKAPPVVALEVTTTPQPSPAGQSPLGGANSAPSATPSVTIAPVTPAPSPVLSAVKQQPLIDSAFISRGISLLLLGLFIVVFSLDIIFTESRKTIRLAGHSFDHLLFMLAILAMAIALGIGAIG